MSTRRRAAIGASEGKDWTELKNANPCELADENIKSLTDVKKHANIYKKPYPLSDGSSIKEHLKFNRGHQAREYQQSKNQAILSTQDKSQAATPPRKRSRKA
jgi:hypothetical protein